MPERCWRRRPSVRAFENRHGGWTLGTATGELYDVAGLAGRCIWEALAEGATLSDIAARLAALFPGVHGDRLRRDAISFLDQLERLGLVEADLHP